MESDPEFDPEYDLEFDPEPDLDPLVRGTLRIPGSAPKYHWSLSLIIGLAGAHLTPPTREEAVNSAWLTGCVLPWTDWDLYLLGLSLTMTVSRHDGDRGQEARPGMPVTGVAAAGQDLTAGRVAPNGKFF